MLKVWETFLLQRHHILMDAILCQPKAYLSAQTNAAWSRIAEDSLSRSLFYYLRNIFKIRPFLNNLKVQISYIYFKVVLQECCQRPAGEHMSQLPFQSSLQGSDPSVRLLIRKNIWPPVIFSQLFQEADDKLWWCFFQSCSSKPLEGFSRGAEKTP